MCGVPVRSKPLSGPPRWCLLATSLRDALTSTCWNYSVSSLRQVIASGISERKKREQLMRAARRREIDSIIVWKLDRWGRSLHDLVSSLKELSDLEVGFVSLTEAIDLNTAFGRAMAGVLSVFADFEREMLSERVKAGIAQARKRGTKHGRPRSAARHAGKVKSLFSRGISKAELARRLGIGRTSVIRILAQ